MPIQLHSEYQFWKRVRKFFQHWNSFKFSIKRKHGNVIINIRTIAQILEHFTGVLLKCSEAWIYFLLIGINTEILTLSPIPHLLGACFLYRKSRDKLQLYDHINRVNKSHDFVLHKIYLYLFHHMSVTFEITMTDFLLFLTQLYIFNYLLQFIFDIILC